MGKRKERTEAQEKKRNNSIGCLAFIALLAIIGLSVWNVQQKPVYAGVSAEQASYVVTFDANLLTCPNADDSDCDIAGKVKQGTYITLDDSNYEYGGFVGDTDLWVRLDVDGQPLFLSMLYVKPITPEQAINALDSNSMMTATADAN